MQKTSRVLLTLVLVAFASLTGLATAGSAQAGTSWANLPRGNYLRMEDGAWVTPSYLTCQWKNNSAGTTISIRCMAVQNNISDAYGLLGGAVACTSGGCRNQWNGTRKTIYTDGAYHTITNNWAPGGSVATGIVSWIAF